MNKQLLTELWQEMADHLQVALAYIEVLLLAGSSAELDAAQGEIMRAWKAFDTAARPVVVGPSQNGHVGSRGDGHGGGA